MGNTATENLQDYRWEVQKSYIEDPNFGKATKVCVKSRHFDKVDFEMPFKFRMFDDDGNLYYEGVASGKDLEPLYDYGMPNAGCTYIQFFEDGKWVTV